MGISTSVLPPLFYAEMNANRANRASGSYPTEGIGKPSSVATELTDRPAATCWKA